eukprot:9152052-Alexandrium_andersonii.AAC.1
MAWLLRSQRVFRHYIKMKNFGHDNEKATWLYSGHPWISEIDLYQSPNTQESTKAPLSWNRAL